MPRLHTVVEERSTRRLWNADRQKVVYARGAAGCDAEVGEEGLHADAEGLVVAVDGGPVCGLAAQSGAADTGQDGADDLVAEGEQAGDGAGGLRADLVAP